MYRHPPNEQHRQKNSSKAVKGPARGPTQRPGNASTSTSETGKQVLAQPRDLTWDEFKTQYKHKLDFDGTKEMMEWRKQLDAARPGALKDRAKLKGKQKKKKKRKRESDSSEDDSNSDSDDSEREKKRRKKKKKKKKHKKKKKKKHKKRKKRSFSSSSSSEDGRSGSTERKRDKQGEESAPVRLSSFFNSESDDDSDN
jgi:hypothetical protein